MTSATTARERGRFDRGRLFELAGAVCDGAATPEQIDRLDGLLADSEQARRLYVRWMDLHFDLDELAPAPRTGSDCALAAAVVEETFVEGPASASDERRHPWRAVAWDWIAHPTALSLIVSGLFLAVILLSMALLTLPSINSSPVAVPSRDDYVARLYNLRDAQWVLGEGQEAPRFNDDLLRGQTLRLASGLAQIVFDSGASVLLEGPARLTLGGDNRGRLASGKLVARVPERAVGFIIETPTAVITDLGTEFGVEVAGSDLHAEVFEGRVRLDPIRRVADTADETGGRILTAGSSVRVEGGRIVEESSGGEPREDGPSSRFVRRLPGPARPAYAAAVMELRPLEYYRLSNAVGERRGRLTLNGVEVGVADAERVLAPEGDFAGFERINRAARFRGGRSDVLTDLATGWSSDSGTILYWIRMEDGGHTTQTHLFGSVEGGGDFGQHRGSIATFARRDGSFGLLVDTVQLETEPRAIAPLTDWHHLAFTWQREAKAGSGGRIAIYLDGQAIVRQDELEWNFVEMGAVRFGKEQTGQRRIFRGLADEIAIFEQALAAEEIAQLYQLAVAGAVQP